MKKIKKIAITGRIQNSLAVSTAKNVIEFLEEEKISFEVDSFFPVIKKNRDLNKIDSDLVLCFGGDGSLLHAFHELKKNVPVLGINCGSRGSLCAIAKEDWESELPKVIFGKIEVEKRSRLKVFVDGKIVGEALNEALIVPLKPGRLLKYRVSVDNNDLGLEADDGLIVATPTGSTAHAQSAGGPNITPSAQVFVVVRVNPIDLNRRPLVVNDHSKIKLFQIEQTPVSVILDGQLHFSAKKEVLIVKGSSVLLAKVLR